MNSLSFYKRFQNMPKNVRVIVLLHPLWSIPFNLVSSYSSLYMINQGISATNVGIISSTTFIVKTVVALFAGFVVNKLGRRRAAGILDIIAWSIPMLIFSMATNYWQFFVASLIACITPLTGICTTCFMVEDVEEEHRIKAFNYLNIVGSLSTFVVPISGILIASLSFVPALRKLYFFAFCSMFVLAICKTAFLKETSYGKKLMKDNTTSLNPLKNLPRQLKYIGENRKLIMLFGLNILLNFAVTMNGLFCFPFFTKTLHFSEATLSVLPVVTTVSSLIIYFFIVPNIKNKHRSLLLSIILLAFGTLVFLISPYVNRNMMYLGTMLWAVATATMSPVLNTMIANTLDDGMRTEILGLFNVLSTLFLFPAGFIGGVLFDKSPSYPIYFIFAIYVIGCFIYLFFGKRNKQWN